MGDFQLGALLGRNQSFERFAGGVPAGWQRASEQASFFQAGCATAVHSSAAALHTVAGSTGGGPEVLRYDHGTAGDAHRVWFPEVTTHVLHSTVWARAVDAPSSGALRWRLLGDAEAFSAPFAHASSLAHHAVQTWVASAAGVPETALARLDAAGPDVAAFVDDVLTQVDVLTLHPAWSLERRREALETRQRTPAGTLHGERWATFPAFRVPVRWLGDSEAALLHWWWERQLALALTLDGSDAATTLVCRIVNDTQPLDARSRPYGGLWQGRLELAGVNPGALSF